MRIAFCSEELDGVRGGGIGTYVSEAAKALADAGHEVWLLTSGAGLDESAREALRRRGSFERVLFVEDGAALEGSFAFGDTPLRFAALVERALTAANLPFDYIECADFGGWGAQVVERQRRQRAFGDAVVTLVLHSPTYECSQYNRTLRLMTPAERDVVAIEDATIRNAPAVWSPSTRLRQMVAARLGLPAEFADVIRYPMSLAAAPSSLPAPGRSLEQLRFLYFGRVEPRKGVRALVDAFAVMPAFSIEVVGGDGETSPLQTSEVDYLRARGAQNVTFAGRLPRAQMLERLQAADVVILPSPWENWPNTCIEAMAAGRVVIGGRNGGMGEMIEHGVSGFLCDGSDAADIARVVQGDLAAALPRLDEIGRSAADRIRALSAPERYVRSIEAFVAKHRPPAKSRAQRPRVSVVVVAAQCRAFAVPDVVDAVLAQAGDGLEVVVACGDGDEAAVAALADDPRIRRVRTEVGGAAAREAAIAATSGDLVACLAADTRWLPGHLDAVLEAFAASPDAAAVMTGFRVAAPAGRSPTVVWPLAFERPLALLRCAREEACVWFRREVWVDRGVRFARELDRYAEWSFWVALAREGVAVECVGATLCERFVQAAPGFDARGWDQHLAEVGLMVERELDLATSEDERDGLRDLLQSGGIGAHAAGLRGVGLPPDRPARVARRARPGVTRYAFADRLGAWLERRPVLHRAARSLLSWAMRRHRDRDARR